MLGAETSQVGSDEANRARKVHGQGEAAAVQGWGCRTVPSALGQSQGCHGDQGSTQALALRWAGGTGTEVGRWHCPCPCHRGGQGLVLVAALLSANDMHALGNQRQIWTCCFVHLLD